MILLPFELDKLPEGYVVQNFFGAVSVIVPSRVISSEWGDHEHLVVPNQNLVEDAEDALSKRAKKIGANAVVGYSLKKRLPEYFNVFGIDQRNSTVDGPNGKEVAKPTFIATDGFLFQGTAVNVKGPGTI